MSSVTETSIGVDRYDTRDDNNVASIDNVEVSEDC
jgi:hypothetical protein